MQINKLFIFFLFLWATAQGQVVKGFVSDIETNESLMGASVYFDGTTIGTTTNEEGYFELDVDPSINAVLVVSFIGYEVRYFDQIPVGEGKMVVKLQRVNGQLDEVVITDDPWSRERKLRIFKAEFLGAAHSGCQIVNEDDIRLRYDPRERRLMAYTEVPIEVVNKHLGYRVSYDLQDFYVNFGRGRTVYYAGTSYFRELKSKKRTASKHLKRRRLAYWGSTLHFMRSLRDGELAKNNFELYHKGFKFFPARYITVSDIKDASQVEIEVGFITVVHNKSSRTDVEFRDQTFTIDSYGNHSPPDQIFFGGNMGDRRMGQMLPLDYEPDSK